MLEIQKRIHLITPVFIVLNYSIWNYKAGYTLKRTNTERTVNVRCYHSANVHAEANETLDSRLARFPYEAVHQKQFVRDVDVRYCHACAVRYLNHHNLGYRNHNLSRESFFQVPI